MRLGGWLMRMFSPATSAGNPEDDAILHEEYGGQGTEPAPGGFAGPLSGLQGLEVAESAENAVDATDAPRDPAP
jgi:hypothetical protein